MEKEQVLRLTLSGTTHKGPGPYQVMESGEKKEGFRRPSPWLLSRLYKRDGPKDALGKRTLGSLRRYDRIEFTNGYHPASPRFSTVYGGFRIVTGPEEHTYSNGLVVRVDKGDIAIRCF
jgi:hypothetical protein